MHLNQRSQGLGGQQPGRSIKIDGLSEPDPVELDSLAESIIKREEIAWLREDDKRDRLLGAELGILPGWEEHAEELMNGGGNWLEQHMIEEPMKRETELLLPLVPSKGNVQPEEEIKSLHEGKHHYPKPRSESELRMRAEHSCQVLGPLLDMFCIIYYSYVMPCG